MKLANFILPMTPVIMRRSDTTNCLYKPSFINKKNTLSRLPRIESKLEIFVSGETYMIIIKKMQASLRKLPAFVFQFAINIINYFFPIVAFLPHKVHLPYCTEAVSLTTIHLYCFTTFIFICSLADRFE